MKRKFIWIVAFISAYCLSGCSLIKKVEDEPSYTETSPQPVITTVTEQQSRKEETTTPFVAEQGREDPHINIDISFLPSKEDTPMYAKWKCFIYTAPKAIDVAFEIQEGAEVYITGVSEDSIWYRCRYADGEYYVYSRDFSVNPPSTTKVTTTVTTTTTVSKTTTTTTKTTKKSTTTSATTTSATKKTTRKTTTERPVQTAAPATQPPATTTSATSYTGIVGLNVSYYGGEKEQGDTIPRSDFSVSVEYANGREMSVSDWTATGLGPLGEGNNDVVVSYMGTSVHITVFAKGIGGIKYPSSPKSTSTNFGIVFADVDRTITAVRDGVVISSGPNNPANSNGYSKLGTLNKGDTIKCLGIGKNGWCKVLMKDKSYGFVYNLYVR